MKGLFLVKLGGSLITDKSKPFTEKREIIRRLAIEIKAGMEKTGNLVIVGHGGGSYPHVPAKKYRTAEGMINSDSQKGMAEVQDAASRLNRIVVEEFIRMGLNAVSVSPSSFSVGRKGEVYKAFLTPIKEMLKWGLVPVVYGDVVMDVVKGCTIFSTEKTLNNLALKLGESFRVKKIIHCGMTDGVYDRKGKTVPKLGKEGFEKMRGEIGTSAGIDVTGGMVHKVEECLRVAKEGIKCVIINGNRPGELINTLLGQKHHGTEIGD